MANYNINNMDPKKIKKIKKQGPYLPRVQDILTEDGHYAHSYKYVLQKLNGTLPSGCRYAIGNSRVGNLICYITDGRGNLVDQAIMWLAKTREYHVEYEKLRNRAW